MHLSRVYVYSKEYGTDLGAKILNLVPVYIKDLKTLSTLKNQIKKLINKDFRVVCTKYMLQKLAFCRSF